jgi:MFS family permease
VTTATGNRPATPAVAAPGGMLRPPYRGLTIGIVATILVVAFESMAVATVMPVAVRDLGGLSLYAWGFSAFLTASIVGMVIAGEVGDRRGPLLPYVGSGISFAAGLAVAGTANTMSVFIAGRAMQGFGMGLSIVSLYVVVARAYPEEMHPRVFSAVSSAWVLPSLIGPAIAGWVAEELSWRLVFLGVLPLIVPALALVLPAASRHGGPALDAVPRNGFRRVLLAVGVASGVTMLQVAGQRIDDTGGLAGTAGLAVTGLVLLLATLPWLLPRGTLRAGRGLPMTVLMRGLVAGAFFGAEAFVPLMFVRQQNLSPGLAGLALTGGALGWALGSWYQGRPSTSLSRPALVRLGCSFVALGIAGLSLSVWPSFPPYLGGLFWTAAGLGMGLAMASVSVLVLELSPKPDQGANSAGLQVSDGVGCVLLIGVAGAIFATFHGDAGTDAGTFLAIYLVMAAVAAAGAVLAPRLRPRSA